MSGRPAEHGEPGRTAGPTALDLCAGMAAPGVRAPERLLSQLPSGVQRPLDSHSDSCLSSMPHTEQGPREQVCLSPSSEVAGTR